MVAALCVRVLVLSLFALWPDVDGHGGGDKKPSAISHRGELIPASPQARAAFFVYRGDDLSASDTSQARPVEGYSRLSSVFSSEPRSYHEEEIFGDVPEGPAVLQTKEGMWDFPQLPDSAIETPKPWPQVPKEQMPLPKKEGWWTGFGQQQSPTHQANKPQLPPWLKLPGQKLLQHPSPPTYPVDKNLPPWPVQKLVQHPSPPTYPVDKNMPPWPVLLGQKSTHKPTYPEQKPVLPPWTVFPIQKPTHPEQKQVPPPSNPTYPVDEELPPWPMLPGQKLTYPGQKLVQHPPHPEYPMDKEVPPWPVVPGQKNTYPEHKQVLHPSPPTYPVDKELPSWLTLPGEKLPQKTFQSTYPAHTHVQHPSLPTYPVQEQLLPWLTLPGEKLPQKTLQSTYPAQKLVQQPSHPTYPVEELPPWLKPPGQKPTYPGQKQAQYPSLPTYPVDKEVPPWIKHPGDQLPQEPFLPSYPGQQLSQSTYPLDNKQPPQLYLFPTLPDHKLPQQPSHPTYPVDKEPHSWLKLPGKLPQQPYHPTYPVDKQAKQQPWFTYPGDHQSSVPQSKDNTWQFDVNMKAEPRTSSVQVFRMTPRRVPGQSLQRPNMESANSHAEYVPRSGPPSKVYGAIRGSYVWRQPDRGAQRLHGSSSKQR